MLICDTFKYLDLMEPFYISGTTVFKTLEDGTGYVSYDLPGVKLEDLKVDVLDKVVTIKGERKSKYSAHLYKYSVLIPLQFDPESLTAALVDGVLTLEVKPKATEVKVSRTVPVQG